MKTKNINLTTEKETIIPIYYIDSYRDIALKSIMQDYKFKNQHKSEHLLNTLIDLCVYIIYENKDSNIIFTYPPSTMFYRKEKSIDSMGNLIHQAGKYLNFYWRQGKERYYFKSMFSTNKKYLKNKKAQHIDGDRSARTKNLDQRYYINFWNRRHIKENTIIIIIDDISSTGGTLSACKKTLEKITQNKKLNNVEILLYSLFH